MFEYGLAIIKFQTDKSLPICFVKDLFNTITSNQKVWMNMLFIITFDEHGGTYDHLMPPKNAEAIAKGVDDPQIAQIPKSICAICG